MSNSVITRRSALALAAGALSVPLIVTRALSAPYARFRAFEVDVAPLRANNTPEVADQVARMLPGFLRQYFAPYYAPGDRGAAVLRARVDTVWLGAPGSAGGGSNSNDAVDWITGVASVVVGVHIAASYPVQSAVQAGSVPDFDVSGGGVAFQRVQNLAQAYAQWLPGQMGL